MAEDLATKISNLSTGDASWAEVSFQEEKAESKLKEDCPKDKKSDLASSESTSEEKKDSKQNVESPKQSLTPASSKADLQSPAASSDEHKSQLKSLIESVQSVNIQVKLADQQADINSPLYSAHSFEELGLSPELLKGIYAMKFVKPSKVQEKALPLLLANPPTNMIAQSQSGTGKTAAFTLTMLSRVDSSSSKEPQAICVAPARELAKQIYDVACQMAKFTKIEIAEAVPESVPQKTRISAQVVIGTPGTVLELAKRGLLPLGSVKVLVFDEADVMLDKQTMGVQSLRLKKLCPAETQILLFSATFSAAVEEFALKVAEPANRITLKREELSIDAIKQFWMQCSSPEGKLRVLSSIYGLLTVGSSIIFVQTRATAESVQKYMQQEGYTTEFLHGKLAPEERDAVIDGFRRGITKVLITTNVLARGIDVSHVSLVINFDLPVGVDGETDFHTYLHRIGRTGRFGRRGTAINLVHDKRSLQHLEAIRKHFGKEIYELPSDDLEALDELLKCEK